jgi:hypothetical protein
MDAKKKYSDRRHSERNSNPRRDSLRLNRSFDISILDHKGRVVNVSVSGVYFEVTTNDMEAFPIGTTIPLQIKAEKLTYTIGMDKKYLISGSGKVIRNYAIENPGHVNSLGVALKFTEKMNLKLDND